MSFIGCHFVGRFGNQIFSYACARAYAERNSLELQTDQWAGQKVFDINDPPISNTNVPRKDENNLVEGDKNFTYLSYSQQQKCATYTVEQIKRWFKFRPEILAKLESIMPKDSVVGHRRIGDYPGSGFPVVSQNSYLNACHEFNLLQDGQLVMVTEENPMTHPEFKDELACIPDFYRLMKAPILLRGNSTFSWWAAALGGNRVFAPIVKGIGLVGGQEVDVKFVEGNHPATADFDFVTNIHLKP